MDLFSLGRHGRFACATGFTGCFLFQRFDFMVGSAYCISTYASWSRSGLGFGFGLFGRGIIQVDKCHFYALPGFYMVRDFLNKGFVALVAKQDFTTASCNHNAAVFIGENQIFSADVKC